LVIVVVARVEVPVTANVPPTVSKLEMVVLPVTVKVLPPTKVKLELVAKVLVPWPNKMSLTVRFWSWIVGVAPPEDRTEPEPLTAVTVPAAVVVAIILPFWSTAKTEEVRPLPRESWEMVVVARVEVPVTNKGPETVRAVVEAFCREVLPETVKILEIVVDPVTARVLDVVLKVKLVEVPMTFVPCPNKMSLAVRFWSWIVGVVPPEEITEPLPLTEVTVPAAVVVAIILPFWSTAKTEEVRPLPRESWEMVVVARVEVPVTFRVPEKEGELDTAMVLVPEMTMLLPAVRSDPMSL
jgi:hypothetical protein